MNRLILSAVAAVLFASQVGACTNDGVKLYLYNCFDCNGAYIMIHVCTSTVSGKCEEFHDQKECGDCYVGEAGTCLSASNVGRKAKADDDLLADATVVNRLGGSSCSATQNLENWVHSKPLERQR